MKMFTVKPVVTGAATALAAIFAGDALAAEVKQKDPYAYNSLTWRGITLFGTIDLGYSHQTRGLPWGPYGSAADYQMSSSKEPHSGCVYSGWSTTSIGVKGEIPLSDDISGVFRLDTGFNPYTMTLTDGPRSLIEDSVPSSPRTVSGDSSRAGQIFNGSAYVGATSKTFGTLTWGRQKTLLYEALGEYDAASGSFSAIGDGIGGMGSSTSSRLNSSLTYFKKFGDYRVGLQYQFGGQQYALFDRDGVSGRAMLLQLGGNAGNLSMDFIYGNKLGALSARASTVQPGTLRVTASDGTAYALMASYKLGPAKLYGGYAHIHQENAASPVAVGSEYLGDYLITRVDNDRYPHARKQDHYWTGVKYVLSPRLDLRAGYYVSHQNSYGLINCSDSARSSCSGMKEVLSLSAIYKLMPRVDLYGGVVGTRVHDGRASGYATQGSNKADSAAVLAGARFRF